LLTLYITPVIYLYMEKFTSRSTSGKTKEELSAAFDPVKV
jgi:hypothetical protein